MPRKRRFYLSGVPAHVVQRGNCRQAVFFDDEDYRAYLNWLAEGAAKHACRIHAYVLMTNHVHLLVTPDYPEAISHTIQYVGRRYVSYINRRHSKSGTLWEGRHKGCVIDGDAYLLACMRYIELNPVRAGLVNRPFDYPWSSYHANAAGKADLLINSCVQYQALGRTPASRQHAYRELFCGVLDPEHVHDIRATLQTGTPLGSHGFRREIEIALETGVGYARPGRPKP